jgi:hypothetical protein
LKIADRSSIDDDRCLSRVPAGTALDDSPIVVVA